MPELTQAVTALPGVASAGAEPVAKGAPTREATLILLPRRFGEAAGKDLQILGLPLLQRAILAAERAGFRDIYVLSERPAADLALEGMNAALLDAAGAIGCRITRGPSRAVLDSIAPCRAAARDRAEHQRRRRAQPEAHIRDGPARVDLDELGHP